MFLLMWIAYCMSVACEAAWPKNERSLNCRSSQTFLNYSKRGSCCRDGKSTATFKLQSWPCLISKLALYLSTSSEAWTQIGRCKAKQELSSEKNKKILSVASCPVPWLGCCHATRSKWCMSLSVVHLIVQWICWTGFLVTRQMFVIFLNLLLKESNKTEIVLKLGCEDLKSPYWLKAANLRQEHFLVCLPSSV